MRGRGIYERVYEKTIFTYDNRCHRLGHCDGPICFKLDCLSCFAINFIGSFC